MHILMITPQPFFQPRGTPFSVYYRAKALTELGHSVDIVTYHLGEDVEITGARIVRAYSCPLIKSIKVGPSLKKVFLDFILFNKVFMMLVRNRYDCIHAHEEAVYFALILKKLFRLKVIYDMHSYLSQQMHNFMIPGRKIIAAIFKWLDRWAIRRADAVITICPDLSNIVTEIDESKFQVMIENSQVEPVSCNLSPSMSSDQPELGDLTGCGPVVLYAGTFEKYQGLSMLLDSIPLVLRVVSDVKFVLAGGQPGQITELQDRAASLKISDQVIFTGLLPHQTAGRYIEDADIVVSPRIAGTNTPLKVFTYLHGGKAMVVTDIYSHRQVLNDKTALLTAPDPVALAEGIITLLKDEQARDNLATRAREYYEANYGEEIYQNKLAKVIHYIEDISCNKACK